MKNKKQRLKATCATAIILASSIGSVADKLSMKFNGACLCSIKKQGLAALRMNQNLRMKSNAATAAELYRILGFIDF